MSHDPDRATPARVSVIVPAYQAEKTLGGTLSGLLTQTYRHLEIIVVDDGSSDRTSDIAEAYGGRVRLVVQENAGVSAARNTGAALAGGELLVFCDSDDILLPPAVEAMVGAWDAAGGGSRLVTCNAYPLTVSGIDPRRRLAISSFPAPAAQRIAVLRSNIALMTSLVPADVFAELGGFDTTLSVVEDWDLWLRAVYAGVEIVYERRPLALYRWRAQSLSSDGERLLSGEDAMFARFESRHGERLRAEERAVLRERAVGGSPWRSRAAGDAALRRGDARTAAREYRRAARFFPQDRRFRLRALSLSLAPSTARLWRARDARIDAATGRSDTGPGVHHG